MSPVGGGRGRPKGKAAPSAQAESATKGKGKGRGKKKAKGINWGKWASVPLEVLYDEADGAFEEDKTFMDASPDEYDPSDLSFFDIFGDGEEELYMEEEDRLPSSYYLLSESPFFSGAKRTGQKQRTGFIFSAPDNKEEPFTVETLHSDRDSLLLSRMLEGGESQLAGRIYESVQNRLLKQLKIAELFADRQKPFLRYLELRRQGREEVESIEVPPLLIEPLTQKEIAEQIEVNQSTISRLLDQMYLSLPGMAGECDPRIFIADNRTGFKEAALCLILIEICAGENYRNSLHINAGQCAFNELREQIRSKYEAYCNILDIEPKQITTENITRDCVNKRIGRIKKAFVCEEGERVDDMHSARNR